MRRVIDTIRGRTYEEALLILEILPYRATEPILKTLLSVDNSEGKESEKIWSRPPPMPNITSE